MVSYENILEKTLLYDFYGELLTKRQKEIYEAVFLEDLSYGEISSIYNISKQAVSDMIKRVNLLLEDYELKLGLVKKFIKIKDNMDKLYISIKKSDNLSKDEKDFLKNKIDNIFKEL